ncbi:Lrp/AsnC family transcriptional regulator [Streptomyces sp. NPDC048277]|uniref:Lrp/AsnC family transcriptional regulator n=1 Tax=Streptomyces sp. NPDC048277 TaxID=3155027 RepID=UPI0034119B18
MFDHVDGKILRALQCAPRLPFRRIGEVAGVSEQTAARRYQALRRDGVLRVLGLVNPRVYGSAQWVARIRCRPDRVGPLAHALARRPDIAYAHLASGGSEIFCVIRSPLDTERDDVLFRQLPRSASVLDISIELLLHEYGAPGTAEWTGYGDSLDAEQVRLLTADRPPPVPGPPPLPADEDAPLLDALAQDGRTTQTRLAELTGWSPARVARRLESLETSGTLEYEIELLPERLGYPLNATLWLRVAPAHLERVGEEFARHEEVPFAGAVSGEYNLMVSVISRDPDDFYRYLTTRVAATPGIDGYSVSMRVRPLKKAVSLISRGRLVPLTSG